MKLKTWVKEARTHAKLTQESLGEAIGVGKANVSAWENGRHEPSLSQIKQISARCDYSADAIFGTLTTKHINTEVAPNIKGQVPLVSWVQAGNWGEVIDNFTVGDAEKWLSIPKNSSRNTFALRVRGISMEPKFQDGDIIFVDPNVETINGKMVIVRLDDEKEATFKQLIIEDGKMYLRPLNPDWPGEKFIPIKGNATICGVVIGKWTDI